MGCLVGEFFTLYDGDLTRTDDTRRVYGLININTASHEVLKWLPWPDTFKNERSDIADYIIAYDHTKTRVGSHADLLSTPTSQARLMKESW